MKSAVPPSKRVLFSLCKGMRLGILLLAMLPSKSNAGELRLEEVSISQRWRLHINGLSYHFKGDRSIINEVNYGVGASYCAGTIKSSLSLLDGFKFYYTTDFYSDSFSNFGYQFGTAFQRPLSQKLDWGFNAGLVHEDNLERKSGLYLHPYVAPYLQTRFNSPVNLRLSYIPPVKNGGVFTLQLIMQF